MNDLVDRRSVLRLLGGAAAVLAGSGVVAALRLTEVDEDVERVRVLGRVALAGGVQPGGRAALDDRRARTTFRQLRPSVDADARRGAAVIVDGWRLPGAAAQAAALLAAQSPPAAGGAARPEAGA